MGEQCTTSRDSVLFSSSGVESPTEEVLNRAFRSLRVTPSRGPDALGTSYPFTRPHIPEERRSLLHRCEILKTLIFRLWNNWGAVIVFWLPSCALHTAPLWLYCSVLYCGGYVHFWYKLNCPFPRRCRSTCVRKHISPVSTKLSSIKCV